MLTKKESRSFLGKYFKTFKFKYDQNIAYVYFVFLNYSFIAKTNNSVPNGDSTIANINTTNNHTEDTHECFVFISSKLASDITLTIGQAFELAYRRYVTDGTKVNELTKVQLQNKQLENTSAVYRQRLKDLVELVPKSELDRLLLRYGVREICEVPSIVENGVSNHVATLNGNGTSDLGINSRFS